MLVIRFAGKVCAAVAVAAAIGAGPASAATGVPLEPATATAQPTAGQPAPIFVPDSGSASVYNNAMCQLHTIVPSMPCMYT